jgi:hypothetical protein
VRAIGRFVLGEADVAIDARKIVAGASTEDDARIQAQRFGREAFIQALEL